MSHYLVNKYDKMYVIQYQYHLNFLLSIFQFMILKVQYYTMTHDDTTIICPGSWYDREDGSLYYSILLFFHPRF